MGFGKDGKGAMLRERVVDGALGALGSSAAVLFGGLALTEDFRLLKSEVVALVNNLTTTQGEGLIFGICNGELSATEVDECIEAAGPLDRNDRVSSERAMRNVKILGVLKKNAGADGEGFFEDEGGTRILRSKHRWTYSNPEGWDWFIINIGGSLTTGATLQIQATHYGVWVT